MAPSKSPLNRLSLLRTRIPGIAFGFVAMGVFMFIGNANEEEGTLESNPADESESVVVGPWGKLECFPVILEPPSSHLWAALFDDRSYWSFPQLPEEEVYTLLETLKFSQETLALLRSDGRWQTVGNSTEVDISDAIIESMTSENRTALAKWFRLNNLPFFSKLLINLEGGNFSAFDNGMVAPETLALVKGVSFPRRNVLSVMDRPYIIRKLGDNDLEKEKFLRAIFATRSLIVRLVIDESTDLPTVINYWSANGLNPGIESVLNGVQGTLGTESVDIVHLLPSVPRRYLFGFTNVSDVGPVSSPDCFWAAVQFFKQNVSPRMLDPLFFYHYLSHDFQKVEGNPQFGDVVCMFNSEDNSFLHSYVHIADDIVFSKNGASFVRPYTLTRKADMLSVYLDETKIRVEIFRRKPGN